MKNYEKLNFCLLLIMPLLVITCKKKDYREQYTGNYQFTVYETKSNYIDSIFSDTTINYVGEISFGLEDNEIKINYLPNNNSLNVILEPDGTLKKPPQSGLGWGFSGKFSTNEQISFSVATGPAEERIETNVNGIKE